MLDSNLLHRICNPAALCLAWLFIVLSPEVGMAHNLDQVNTAIAFDEGTLDLIEDRYLQGDALVREGDVLTLIFKSTPGPGTSIGAGGYFTFYIPPGTQVLGVDYGRPDGAGGFTVLPMKQPAPMPLGRGSISASSTAALVGLQLGPNITGQTSLAVNASGLHLGTLAGVYGDVGVFYSTDPATAFGSFVDSGGYDGKLATQDNTLVNNSGNALIPQNRWDAAQLIAFGLKNPAAPLMDSNGRGNAPWGMGSPVAGPESGYAWGFNWDYWRVNPTDPQRMKNSIEIGPWQRIRHPGSTVAVDVPGVTSSVLGVALASADHLGVAVDPANPLPPTVSWTDETSPKAVRIAYGELKIGRSEFGRIRLRVLADAPENPLGPSGSIQFHSDVSGGDAGGTDNGKDHVWRYVKASPLTVETAGLIQKRFVKTPIALGETSYFDLVVANTGAGPMTNAVLTDSMPTGLTFVSASVTPSSTSPLTWNLGTIPSQGFRKIRVHYRGNRLGTWFNQGRLTWTGNVKEAMDSVDVTREGSEPPPEDPPLDPPEDPPPPLMSIGNLIFHDVNDNGRADAGEGLSGIWVELYDGDDDPETTEALASLTTAADGNYLFVGLSEGGYRVHLPAWQFQEGGPLLGMFSVPGVGLLDDNVDEDGENVSEPWVQGISSREVHLSPFTAPLSGGIETGYQGESDVADDANIDLTVDLGLFRGVGVGNLVFIDANNNGRADPGEGYDGVTLSLYRAGDELGVDQPLATTTTEGGGQYLFGGIKSGAYKVHIDKEMFTSDTPLHGMISIPNAIAGDDDVGDNASALGDLSDSGVTSEFFFVGLGSAPTADSGETGATSDSDDHIDAAIDLTIDFGFQRPMKIGNLVFEDLNDNGRFDDGEGVDEVVLHLYYDGQTPFSDPPLFVAETDELGRYELGFLYPGRYFVHIPPVNFQMGEPLEGKMSMVGFLTEADDDVGEIGIDDASPQIHGIRSNVFELIADGAPTDDVLETGGFAESDNIDDANGDLTVDFGFAERDPLAVGVGNVVFIDQNGDGRYQEGEGVDGVKVEVYSAAAPPGVGLPVATMETNSGGRYLFLGLSAGDYVVHVAASNFAEGGPLVGMLSVMGHGGDDGSDDDFDENGIDVTTPWVTGVSSTVVQLQPGTEPTSLSSEFGKDGFVDEALDADVDLTVDFGFFRSVGLGNLVFLDANGNGRADAGEGVAGVPLQLYVGGTTPLFDVPMAETVTDENGGYLFDGLVLGTYFVFIPETAFEYGAPLFAALSLSETQEGDDDAGEDGLDNPMPWIDGIQSDERYLEAATAPIHEPGWNGVSDEARDGDVDLTLDFGFSRPPLAGVSGKVCVDRDGSGNLSAPGPGLRGVMVRLFRDSNGDGFASFPEEILAEQRSGGDGSFLFENLPPGPYLLVQVLETPGLIMTADSEGLEDGLIGVALNGADSAGHLFLNQVEPQGYIYESYSGHLVQGGHVEVSGPGTVYLLLDGSTGEYAWTTDGTDGVYHLIYHPPPTYQIDPLRQPELVAINPSGQPSPYRVGSGVNAQGQLQDGSAQANPWFTAFDLSPDAALISRNNIPVRKRVPTSWSDWRELKGLTSEHASLMGDQDSDGCVHLIEFAFDLSPLTGLQTVQPLIVDEDPVTGQMRARVRKVSGIEGVECVLEGIGDLSQSPQGWFPIQGLEPRVEEVTPGVEVWTYTGLEQVAGLTQQSGFIRMRVTSDPDVTGEAGSAVTEAWGWLSDERPGAGLTTFSSFARSPAIFIGRVDQSVDDMLDVTLALGGEDLLTTFNDGRTYYVEVMDGALAGNWLDLDESANVPGWLRVRKQGSLGTLSVPLADLTGLRVRVVPHRTLKQEVPPTRVTATLNPASATRALFFDRLAQSYQTYWAFANPSGAQWLLQGTLQDMGHRVIAPGEGLFLEARASGISPKVVGQVTALAQALSLANGFQMVGAPWPLQQSFGERAMNAAHGFMGAQSAASADRVLSWNADLGQGGTGYQTYFYLRHQSFDQWTLQGDLLFINRNETPLFQRLRAIFVSPRSAREIWLLPLPWEP